MHVRWLTSAAPVADFLTILSGEFTSPSHGGSTGVGTTLPTFSEESSTLVYFTVIHILMLQEVRDEACGIPGQPVGE